MIHPYCNTCGWRKGGIDSWNGLACKCGESAPAIQSITVRMDQLWRDTDARRRFEAVSGLAPLAVSQDELDRQWFSGHLQMYHERFLSWAAEQKEAADG